MNLLIITPKIPYPPDEGGKISQFAVIDYLRKDHTVILVLATYCTEDENNLLMLEKLWPEVTIEKIKMGSNIRQKREASLYRNLVQFFSIIFRKSLSIKKSVKGLFISEENKNISLTELDSPWIAQIAPVKTSFFIARLHEIIKNKKIDIIQIDLLDYIDLALALPKEIKKVFVHHELKFARLATAFFPEGTDRTPFSDYILNLVREQELTFLKYYDGIIVFSENDRKKLTETLSLEKVFVSPFPVLDTYFRPINPELLKIKKLVFVGGEEHAPNKDAIEWYFNEIGSEIRKHHDLRLHVVGNWSSETIKKLSGNSLVHFAGYVEDLISYCENSIMITPVRTGSGIRAKILYAMAQGVPVISASVGCEGIEVKDKVDLIIADTPGEFAEAVNLLISDMGYTLNMVTSAQKIIKEKYSQQVAGELRINCLKQIFSDN